MNRQEYLKLVCNEIHFIFDRKEVQRELEQHLEDSMLNLMIEERLSKEEAELQAVAQMGDPVEVGKQLNEEHHPVLGYLWMMSKVLLFIILPFALFMAGIGTWGALKMVTPTKIDNSTENYPLNMELDIPTHRIKLDYICIDDQGNSKLSYRAWTKYSYSRAGWSSDLFYLEDDRGEYLHTGGMQSNSFIGCYGVREFDWPENGILNLKLRGTEEVIEIDLEEYCNETR